MAEASHFVANCASKPKSSYSLFKRSTTTFAIEAPASSGSAALPPASPVTHRQSTTDHQVLTTTSIRSIFVNVQLQGQGSPLVALLNPGASNLYIDLDLIQKLKLQKHYLNQAIEVTNIDGRTFDLGFVTYECCKTIVLNGFKFPDFRLLALPLPGNALIVLGYDFHKLANIDVDFKNKVITFQDRTCNAVLEPLARVKLRRADALVNIIDPTRPGKFQANWLGKEHYVPPNLEKCLKLVPSKNHNLIDMFSKANNKLLPAHTEHEIKLNLVLVSVPPFGGIYRSATAEQTTLKEYVDDMLAKGLIRKSSLSAAWPVPFVPTKRRKLRLCVDYRRLNNMLVKDGYPLPSTDMLLDQLLLATVYTR